MHQSIRDIVNQGTSKNASEEQHRKLLALYHQPDLEFELKKHLLEDLNEVGVIGKDPHFFDEIFEKWWRKRPIELLVGRKRNHFAIRMAQWAAILVVGLFVGYYVNSTGKDSVPAYYTSVAPNGSVSEMYLPDGTHIYLNAGSEIKYSIDGIDGMREVFLKGEAWFQVAKMKEKPFLVHTSFYDVKVTGTSFNVKAYPIDDQVVTTLEEGSVQIASSENLQLGKDINILPGEQLVYHKGLKSIQIDKVNTKWFTSWKDNKLVFINMSLKDLRVLLERKYGVDIEIVDQSILNYHYDGTLKDETLMEVLDILRHTLPIKYQIVDQKIIINKK